MAEENALPTSDELKVELTARLNTMAHLVDESNAAIAKLRQFSPFLDGLQSDKILQDALTTWLEEHLKRLSECYQGKTTHVLTLEDLDEELTSIRALDRNLNYDLRTARITIVEAVNRVVEQYNFTELAQEFSTLARSLEHRGYINAAKYLADKFHIEERDRGYLPPRKKNKVYLFENLIYTSVSSYHYDMPRDYEKIAQALELVEDEIGVTNLAKSMRIIANAIEKEPGVFPTRTVIGKGNPIEVIFYTQHLHFRVTHEAAEAIFAFIKLYTDIELFDFSVELA